MVRRLSLFMTVLLAAGCVTVSGIPTPPPGTPPAPGISRPPPALSPQPTGAPVAVGTESPATSTTTPPPTPEAQPTATEPPERTLAPGETEPPPPLDLTGLLTATLLVVNLTDEQVVASVDLFNEGEKVGTVAQLDIEPYGELLQDVPAATFLISVAIGASDALTCQVTLADGAEIDFAVVGSRVTVTRPDAPPAAPDDLFIESSPLCE